MGAVRNLLVICLPLAVLCHNHGPHLSSAPQVSSPRFQPQNIPQTQLPIFPIDGRRCISLVRRTKVEELPIPYLCIPGKPGGVPLPKKSNPRTSAILVMMYWHGWRVCKYTMKVPMAEYIRVPTCCPGWESGPSGECSVPKGGQMNGPCLNGGFVAPGNGMPKCMCPPGFKGIFCQMTNGRGDGNIGPLGLPIPSLPIQRQPIPSMDIVMNILQQQFKQAMGPLQFDMPAPIMPPNMLPPMPLMDTGRGPVPNPTMLMNMMIMKQMMPLPILKTKSFIKISNPVSKPPRNLPVQKPMSVNINNRLNGMSRNNQQSTDSKRPNNVVNDVAVASVLGNRQQKKFPQFQPKPTTPIFYHKYHINNPQKQILPQQQPPSFTGRVPNKEKCEDILKVGITRCIRDAGIQAFPADIFKNRNPSLTKAICGNGRRIAPCIMAGQNACGTGAQVIITRRMLSNFLSSIGIQCNSMMSDAVPNMPNLPMMPPMNTGRMPSLNIPMPQMPGSPLPSMIPMPPAFFRTLQGMSGQGLPKPTQVNADVMVPVAPLVQDLKRLECRSGGYVVIEAGASVCECPQGFEGENCEIPICESECMNGGICGVIEQTPGCICVTGFTGINCEEAIGPIVQETTADVTVAADDTVLAQDNAPLGSVTYPKEINGYPIPHIPSNPKIDVSTQTDESAIINEPVKTEPTITSVKITTTADPGVKGAGAQAQDVAYEPSKNGLQDDAIFIAGYPLWLILSVSIGFLLLVLIFTTCVFLCVKRRSKRAVDITTVASALPEKVPVKDNIYVVGITPPPVYEVKGIPALSYEEAKGEVITGNRENQKENTTATETGQDEETENENPPEVSRI
ncbi:uncharacterized protein LOC126811680 isoform X1 [Patella vulgata]|uniref:uncharacterized protein LOC126811680 isoform X1 n=1 Tax=Patella vulgata TaxID=6465 RepID=UPI0021805A35|nr:uncharacterized protein LOC126811680 isoform X1 [Patella vulgata]